MYSGALAEDTTSVIALALGTELKHCFKMNEVNGANLEEEGEHTLGGSNELACLVGWSALAAAPEV